MTCCEIADCIDGKAHLYGSICIVLPMRSVIPNIKPSRDILLVKLPVCLGKAVVEPGSSGVLDWDHLGGDGTVKTYVWLKDHDYLAIMKKYPDSSRRLITAYCLEHESEKRKLLKKYRRGLGGNTSGGRQSPTGARWTRSRWQ